ncbi:calcium ion binding protein [Aureococcus anophagefferens]|nr:calcium ion binding protein [Aureococcus anophagefferens]
MRLAWDPAAGELELEFDVDGTASAHVLPLDPAWGFGGVSFGTAGLGGVTTFAPALADARAWEPDGAAVDVRAVARRRRRRATPPRGGPPRARAGAGVGDLSATGAEVGVVFDAPTDRAGAATGAPFPAATSSTSLARRTRPATGPGDAPAAAASATATGLPDDPIVPLVVVEGVTVAAVCEGLNLDASRSTGGGGRGLAYAWAVAADPPLAGGDNATVAAPPRSAAEARGGATLVADSSELEALTGAGVDRLSTARWRSTALTRGGAATGLASASSDARSFRLDAFALDAGAAYELTVTATDAAGAVDASTTVLIDVVRSGVVAKIDGGDRVVSLSEGGAVTVDASGSVDEDVDGATGEAAGLAFSWTCPGAHLRRRRPHARRGGAPGGDARRVLADARLPPGAPNVSLASSRDAAADWEAPASRPRRDALRGAGLRDAASERLALAAAYAAPETVYQTVVAASAAARNDSLLLGSLAGALGAVVAAMDDDVDLGRVPDEAPYAVTTKNLDVKAAKVYAAQTGDAPRTLTLDGSQSGVELPPDFESGGDVDVWVAEVFVDAVKVKIRAFDNRTVQTKKPPKPVELRCPCDYVGRVNYTCDDGAVFENECNGTESVLAVQCATTATVCESWNSDTGRWLASCAPFATNASGVVGCAAATRPELAAFALRNDYAGSLEAYTSHRKKKRFEVRSPRAKPGGAPPRPEGKEDESIFQESLAQLKLFESTRSSWKRAWKLIKIGHPVLNILTEYSEHASRVARLWKFGFEMLVFMSGVALATNLHYPTRLRGPARPAGVPQVPQPAVQDPGVYTSAERDMCEWDACSRSCVFHEPGASEAQSFEHYLTIGLTLAVILPMILIIDVCFEHYLISGVPEALRCCASPDADGGAPPAAEGAPPPGARAGTTPTTRAPQLAAVKATVKTRLDVVDAERMAPLLRIHLMDDWAYVEDRALFETSVAYIIRGRVTAAARWNDEIAAVEGRTAKQTKQLRAAKLMEFERVARLRPLERSIYAMGQNRVADLEAPEGVSAVAYVCAWALVVVIVALNVYYLILTGSDYGPGKTAEWINAVVTSFVLYYLVINPLQILFFTMIGKYCLGELEHRSDLEGGDLVKTLNRVYREATWKPSVQVRFTLALLSWFLRLPEWGQEVLFEELFAFAPLFADAILGFSFVENSFLVDGGGGAKQTRKGSSFLVIGVLFTVMLMLLVAYVLKVVSAPPKRATAPRKKKMPKKAETKSDASMEGIAMTARARVRPEFDDDAVDLGGSPRARSRSGQVDDDGFCPDTPRSAERFGTANLRSPRDPSGQDRDPARAVSKRLAAAMIATDF